MALLALVSVAPAAGLPARSFPVAPPAAAELGEPQLAVAASGAALLGATRLDPEDRSRYAGFWRVRRGDGRLLDLRSLGRAHLLATAAAPGSGFAMLEAAGAAGQPCCDEVLVRAVSSTGRAGGAHTLFRGIGGAVTATLLPLPGHLLAAAASPLGVWVGQGGARGFARARRLSSGGLVPASLAAGALPGGRSLLAWLAVDPAAPDLGPTQVLAAEGTATRAPSRVRVLLRAPAGHQIDELALAPGPAAAALGWVETWFDAGGTLQSRAELTSLTGAPRRVAFQVPHEVVSAPALSGEGDGTLVLALRSCTRYGRCETRAAVRPRGAHGHIGPLRALGAADPGQPPLLAMAPGGGTLAAWVGGGVLRAAYLAPGAARFGASFTLASSVSGAAAAAGPRGFLVLFAHGLGRPALDGLSVFAG